MYIPKCFEQQDASEIKRVIAENPLATLVCLQQSELQAYHIPLYYSEDSQGMVSLKGHIAIANTMHKQVDNGSDILVIFHGPQAYISPSWYPSKQTHHKVVPTWNYISVHIQGEITFKYGASWKLDMLESLTSNMESGAKSAWSVSDAPEDYLSKQMKGIVGLEITVQTVSAKWKLSQNKSDEDRIAVISNLESQNNDRAVEVAMAMKKDDQ